MSRDDIDVNKAKKTQQDNTKPEQTHVPTPVPEREIELPDEKQEIDLPNHDPQDTTKHKATQFDGNPNPQGAPNNPLGLKTIRPSN